MASDPAPGEAPLATATTTATATPDHHTILSSPFLTLSTVNRLLTSLSPTSHADRIPLLSAKIHLLQARQTRSRMVQSDLAGDQRDEQVELLNTRSELAKAYLPSGELSAAESEALGIRSAVKRLVHDHQTTAQPSTPVNPGTSSAKIPNTSSSSRTDITHVLRRIHIDALLILEEVDSIRGRESRVKRWQAEREKLVRGDAAQRSI